MTKKPNIKVQAFIWVALLWILFASKILRLYYRNDTFNFDVNVFGLVMVGLLLWGLEAINLWTLLINFVLNICMFYLPIMAFIVEIVHPYVFVAIYTIFKLYVCFRCFCHVYFLGKRQGRSDTLQTLHE